MCFAVIDWQLAQDPDYFAWIDEQDEEYLRFMALDDLYRDELPLKPITYIRNPDGSGTIEMPF